MQAIYYDNVRSEMSTFLPDSYSKVLEVGCGEGTFRQHLKKTHEYWGIEPVQEAYDVSKSVLDNVILGTYESARPKLPENYFDLVICNDVIEHMIDHDAFFRSIKKHLQDGAHIIASIPNVRYLLNLFELLVKRDWQYKDQGTLDRTHLRFFTQKSLLKTIADHQFGIDKFEGINPYRGNSFAKRGAGLFASMVFGKDVNYLQFGMRLVVQNNKAE
ncbi:MAG: class I SAM-dependent methyltransferase [Calditrichia bacterium]